MAHAPMTYLFRAYSIAKEPTTYVVFMCNNNGERKAFPFTSAKHAKALASALDGLGFTRKRR